MWAPKQAAPALLSSSIHSIKSTSNFNHGASAQFTVHKTSCQWFFFIFFSRVHLNIYNCWCHVPQSDACLRVYTRIKMIRVQIKWQQMFRQCDRSCVCEMSVSVCHRECSRSPLCDHTVNELQCQREGQAGPTYPVRRHFINVHKLMLLQVWFTDC